MKYELYMDVFFLTNFVMDDLLLMIVRKALDLKASQKRVCAAALFGAFASCVIVSIPMPFLCRLILFHVLVNTKMTGILMKTNKWSELWKGILVLYFSSFLLGGIYSSIAQFAGGYTKVGALFFGSAILCYTGISWGIEVLKKLWKLDDLWCEVTISVQGTTFRIPAVIDSGNSLRDHITGKPVHIIGKKAMEKLTNANPLKGIRYIPYRTVREGEAVMPIFTAEYICIHRKKDKMVYHPLIGISEQMEFAEGRYEMILHPDSC